MSPKPILVVNYCIEGLSQDLIIDNIKSIKKILEGSGVNDDYYTFVLPVRSDSHIQVFYDKDIDNDSFNNIRELVDEKLKEFEYQTEEQDYIDAGDCWLKKILKWKR